MCPTIIILISNWPQTGKFSQPLQAGKTVAFDFSHHGHSLVTLYVQFLCSDWSKFGRWVHAENLCSVLNLVYFDSWSWQSFVSNCDLFNCLFLLHVQNEIQLLSGVFCYSWLACFLSFWHYKSLVLLFKGIKGNGPDYISDLFEPRILRYNLRNSDHNLTQPSYNNRYYHNSFSYKASHLWDQLPSYLKRSTELSKCRKHLRSFNLTILRTSCF